MKRVIKIFVLLSFIFLLMTGCDEDDGKVMGYKNVILGWHGKDCGFFIGIDNEHYKPINEDKIREEFKVLNDTLVLMKYIDLKKNITFRCGVVGLPVEIKGIEVINIK